MLVRSADEYEAAGDAEGDRRSTARRSADASRSIGERIAVWQKERQELEKRKGNDWRHDRPAASGKARCQPDAEDAAQGQKQIDRQIAIRATAFDEPIDVCRERIEATRFLLSEFRRQRRLLERSPEARAGTGADRRRSSGRRRWRGWIWFAMPT